MSKKKLLRLAESLYSRPHLISQSGFAAVSHYLDTRNLGILLMEEDEVKVITYDGDDVEDDLILGGVGYISVAGALTYKPVMGMCGEVGCSYQSLTMEMQELVDAGAKVIVMDCDSPGGEGYMAFETANILRKMCDDAGVKWIAYNDGTMASAMYAIACAADEVIANPAAETGSIGVLIALTNYNKALEKAGITRTYISAGESKIPFDADGDWKPDFLADLQAKVDAMYGQFVAHVSAHTGMSEKDVRNTQAKMFMAEDALQMGLINKVMTHEQFVSYIATQTQG
jgi:signal peptide peptidase SppA